MYTHQGTPPPTICSNRPQLSRINPITICSNGILKLLNNLKPGKANGNDGIPARFLRDFATSLTPSLILLFQASLNQHKLPSDWKHVRIVPIIKKDDCKSVTNYRPLSLTRICSKLLEHTLYVQKYPPI